MPKRRTHGSGSIQQIREGYWRLTVSAGRDPVTGKRRRVVRYVRGSRRQAEQTLRELLDEVSRTPAPPPADYTVADLLDDWYREMAAEWAVQTRRTRAEHVEHWKRLLGSVRLRDLDALAIQRAISVMREQGYAPITINNRLAALRGAIKRAIELGRLRSDPMMGVRRPRVDRKPRPVLTEDQLVAVLREARKSRWFAALVLAAHTGMRRGEILGLRWEDVDWDRSQIHIRNIVVYGEDGRPTLQDHPKTPSSRRSVLVDAHIMALLRQHRRRQAEERLRAGPAWEDHGLVFPDRRGRPAHPNGMLVVIERLRQRLGIPWLRVHDLRHAHASHLLAAGVSPAEVAARLGHARPSITMQIYAHALPGGQEELVRRLDHGTKLAPILGVQREEIAKQ